MHSQSRASQEFVEPCRGSCGIAGLQHVVDNLVDRASERAVVLIEQDGGGPFGACLGQQCTGRRTNGMRLFRSNPVAPRDRAASVLHQIGNDPLRGRGAAVAMDFEPFRFETADDDFFRSCCSPTADVNPSFRK